MLVNTRLTVPVELDVCLSVSRPVLVLLSLLYIFVFIHKR